MHSEYSRNVFWTSWRNLDLLFQEGTKLQHKDPIRQGFFSDPLIKKKERWTYLIWWLYEGFQMYRIEVSQFLLCSCRFVCIALFYSEPENREIVMSIWSNLEIKVYSWIRWNLTKSMKSLEILEEPPARSKTWCRLIFFSNLTDQETSLRSSAFLEKEREILFRV